MDLSRSAVFFRKPNKHPPKLQRTKANRRTSLTYGVHQMFQLKYAIAKYGNGREAKEACKTEGELLDEI